MGRVELLLLEFAQEFRQRDTSTLPADERNKCGGLSTTDRSRPEEDGHLL
jgi:hypothetical protein